MSDSALMQSEQHMVSEMAETLIGSEIIKLAAEINEKIRNGERIYNYTIGDFDPKIFPIPPFEVVSIFIFGDIQDIPPPSVTIFSPDSR